MEEIAAGKGRSPKPFMAKGQRDTKTRFKADAVWQSNRHDAEEEKPTPASRVAAAKRAKASKSHPIAKKRSSMPDFVPPQLCRLVARPAAGDDWAHEIKFDGYRMQLRVEDGIATLRTRKGLDWTGKYQPIADVASGLPDCIVDGEIVALDHNGAPDFAALQAAMSDGKVKDLVFFAFDLLFHDGKDLRPLPLAERKAALEPLLAASGTNPTIRFRRAFRQRRRCSSALRLPHVAGRHHLEAAFRALPVGTG